MEQEGENIISVSTQQPSTRIKFEKRPFLTAVDVNARPGTPSVLQAKALPGPTLRPPEERTQQQDHCSLATVKADLFTSKQMESIVVARRRPVALTTVFEVNEHESLPTPPTLVRQALTQPYTQIFCDGATPGISKAADSGDGKRNGELSEDWLSFTPLKEHTSNNFSVFSSRSPFGWTTPSPQDSTGLATKRSHHQEINNAASVDFSFHLVRDYRWSSVMAELRLLVLGSGQQDAETAYLGRPIRFSLGHKRNFGKVMTELHLLVRLANENWGVDNAVDTSSLLDNATMQMTQVLIEEVLEQGCVISPIKVVNESFLSVDFNERYAESNDESTLSSSTVATRMTAFRETQPQGISRDGTVEFDKSSLPCNSDADLSFNETSSTVLANPILDINSEKESVVGLLAVSGTNSVLDLSCLSREEEAMFSEEEYPDHFTSKPHAYDIVDGNEDLAKVSSNRRQNSN